MKVKIYKPKGLPRAQKETLNKAIKQVRELEAFLNTPDYLN